MDKKIYNVDTSSGDFTEAIKLEDGYEYFYSDNVHSAVITSLEEYIFLLDTSNIYMVNIKDKKITKFEN